MLRPKAPKLRIPAVLAVATSVAACSQPPTPNESDASTDVANDLPAEQPCEPVLDMAAAIQPTYRCRDGRTCSDVRPEQADGGVYQVCPGTGGCATLVMSNGQSMVGFC